MSTELAVRAIGTDAVAVSERPRLPGMPTAASLNRRQKAAIVVRLLIAEGATLPLSELPDALQAELTAQMTQMRFVDRTTLKEVIEEFASELDSIGLSFPGGLEGAIDLLEGAISPEMAARLRKQAGAVWADDPWPAIAELSADKLLPALCRESPEIGAVVLSKLKVSKAAELLGKLPGDRARRLTLAVSETADISPDTVRRIGTALAAELKAEPPRAFHAAAVERLGAILNVSASVTRDDVLAGLDEEDAELASQVRRAIFTFEDIPERLASVDVPGLAKRLNQETIITATAGATERTMPAVEFLLSNMSQRLADTIREEASERDRITPKMAEEAQTEIVAAIRDGVESGAFVLLSSETDEAA